jgi:predicted permease
MNTPEKDSRRHFPPRLARALASWLLRGDAGEVIVGDLDQEFAEAVAGGTPLGTARRHYWRQALASIAATRTGAKETAVVTASRPFRPLQGLSLDLRAILRTLRASPGYVFVAVLSLAVGIGANTAVFSMVRQLLIEPLPVDRPSELRLVYWTPNTNDPVAIRNVMSSGYRDSAGVFYRSNVSYAEYTAMRDAASGSADLSGFNFAPKLTTSIEGRPPIVANGMLVSGSFFSTVRPPLAFGRGLAESDDSPGAPAVAVIGYGLWTRLVGNDPNVVGRTIRVSDVPVTIVGVTAAAYRGLSQGGFSPETDVTMAISQQPIITPKWAEPGESLFTAANLNWVRVIARVREGSDARVTDVLQTALRGALPNGGLTLAQAAIASPRLLPGARGLDSLRTAAVLPLRVLSVVVGVVLLIACINIAGLMLARGVSRQRELAVRRALGAGRARIMRQLLLESVALSVAGGAAGLLLAVLTAPVLQSMLTSGLGTSGVGVALDWPLLAATGALACTAGVLAGLLPAIRFSRHGDTMLKERTGAAPRLMIGRALLALQIAVSLPLVVGAGLFLRTINNLASVDLGFNPRGLVLFTLDPTMSGKAPERAAIVFPQVLDRLEQIPGVTSASLSENAMISGWQSDSIVTVNGQSADMFMNGVGPHYLQTMEVPLLSGRSIERTDRFGLPWVVVINQTAAKTFFGAASPIGQHFLLGRHDVEVVGVMGDNKYDDLRHAVPPTMLLSYLQRQLGSQTVVVRAEAPVSTLQPAIEHAVHEVDASLPISDIRTQTDQIDQTIGKERVFTRLLTVFGLFALLLACVGLHGVTSYSVARRTNEFGIRLALGAQRSQLLWLVLRQVVVLAVIGLAIGLSVAWLAGPALRSLLFGLEPNDPVTMLISAALMAAVAIAAGLWPARRAARMEALNALRTE